MASFTLSLVTITLANTFSLSSMIPCMNRLIDLALFVVTGKRILSIILSMVYCAA